MATSFDSIIDMAMVVIRDFKLDTLYEESTDAFKTVLEGYMIKGLPKFQGCQKPLTYNALKRQFDEDLDMYEIDIIADWTVINWYIDQLQDVLEFKEPLRDIDFNKFASGQNLKPRQNYLDDLRKRVKQDTTNYQFLHVNDLPYFNDYK